MDEERKQGNPTPEVVADDSPRLSLVPSTLRMEEEEEIEISQTTIVQVTPDAPSTTVDNTPWLKWVSLALFFTKIYVLGLSCLPYLCSPSIMYPLLGLAAADLSLYL
jgi:hypothetical protein